MRRDKVLYEQIMRNVSREVKKVLNEELYVIGYVNDTDGRMAEISVIETFDDLERAESALEDYEEEYGLTAIDYVNGDGPDLWNEAGEVVGELVFYTKSQYWRGLDDEDEEDEFDYDEAIERSLFEIQQYLILLYKPEDFTKNDLYVNIEFTAWLDDIMLYVLEVWIENTRNLHLYKDEPADLFIDVFTYGINKYTKGRGHFDELSLSDQYEFVSSLSYALEQKLKMISNEKK